MSDPASDVEPTGDDNSATRPAPIDPGGETAEATRPSSMRWSGVGTIASTVGLMAMVVAFVADVVSRFIWTVDWLPRFATITTAVASLCFAIGLVLTVVQGGEDRRATLSAALADLAVLVLLVFSLAMRFVYWEPGYGTPIRAAVPLALAIVVAAWSGWWQRRAELGPDAR